MAIYLLGKHIFLINYKLFREKCFFLITDWQGSCLPFRGTASMIYLIDLIKKEYRGYFNLINASIFIYILLYTAIYRN